MQANTNQSTTPRAVAPRCPGEPPGASAAALCVVAALCVPPPASFADGGGGPAIPNGGTAPTLLIGPVEGLTSAWHVAPPATCVPLGVPLEFKVAAPPLAIVQWEGAKETSRTESESFAVCVPSQGGPALVSVSVTPAATSPPAEGVPPASDDGSLGLASFCACLLDVIDIKVEAIVAAPIVVDDGPGLLVDLALPLDQLNSQLVNAYFGPSIAALVQDGPTSFHTSIDRPVPMSLAGVEPAGFAPLIEWRIDGQPVALGTTISPTIDSVGVHEVCAGPLAACTAPVQVQTYAVQLLLPMDPAALADGLPVLGLAMTDPPGFEQEITWIAATKYGWTEGIVGSGPVFFTGFHDTFGPLPEGGTWSWKGVKADNVVLGQDQKPPCTADFLPPTINIAGVVQDQVLVAPANVLPVITAIDNFDPAPVITATLDGAPYVPGTVISSIGTHVLSITAVDGCGNLGTAPAVAFEILEFPRHPAVAVVAALSCGPGSSFDATILLAASHFNVKDIDLYTAYLWLLDDEGGSLNTAPIPITGSIDPVSGGYDYLSTLASYQQGYWTIHWSVAPADEIDVLGCPAALMITGTGQHGEPGEFDFQTIFSPLVDPNPVQTLTDLGLTNQDPPSAPPQEQEWPECKWKCNRIPGPPDTRGPTIVSTACGAGISQSTLLFAWAAAGRFGGIAFADDAVPCGGSTATSSTVTNSTVMRLWLEGPKTCCNPKIKCVFEPSFQARVEVNPTGTALASGSISIASDCGCGALAVGSLDTMDGVKGWTAFTDPKMCMEKRASVTVTIKATGTVDVFADAVLLNPYAMAKAELRNATPGVTLTGTCQITSGPCAGLSKTFPFK